MNASDIPYDYDCIDENLMKTAFTIDPAYLPKTILEDSILPLAIQMLTTDAKIPCVTKSKDENVCVEGKFRNKDVFFPNVFDEGYTTFVANGLTGLETGLVGKSAVYLHDFAPTDQNENQWDCDPLEFTPKGTKFNVICINKYLNII